MRTEIRRERTIEFFDENFRIDDLKRWKTAEDEMPMNLTGVKWEGTDFESRWPGASFKDKDGEWLHYSRKRTQLARKALLVATAH